VGEGYPLDSFRLTIARYPRSQAVPQSGVAVEAFDFSCVVSLPDGSVAEVQQTAIQRGTRQDIIFFMTVHTHSSGQDFSMALHLSGSSLTNLDGCPGDTRAEKSQRVADALRAWVKEHGVSPDLALVVRVGDGNGHPYGVAISRR
jgi:hypothetical protein